MMTDADIDTEIQKTKDDLGDAFTQEMETAARAFYTTYRTKPSDLIRGLALRVLIPALERMNEVLIAKFGAEALEHNRGVNEIACGVSACVAAVFREGCLRTSAHPMLTSEVGQAVAEDLMREVFKTTDAQA